MLREGGQEGVSYRERRVGERKREIDRERNRSGDGRREGKSERGYSV